MDSSVSLDVQSGTSPARAARPPVTTNHLAGTAEALSPARLDVRLNESVRRHEETIDWRHGPVAIELYRWFEIFSRELFEGELHLPLMRVDRDRCTSVARYRPGRNGLGARHDILINARYAEECSAHLLAGLLHALLHASESMVGRPSRWNYHNREFQRRSLGMGIPCRQGARCVTEGLEPPFTDILARHGVLVEEDSLPVLQPNERKFEIWRCGCQEFEVSGSMRGCCVRCGGRFRRNRRGSG